MAHNLNFHTEAVKIVKCKCFAKKLPSIFFLSAKTDLTKKNNNNGEVDINILAMDIKKHFHEFGQ